MLAVLAQTAPTPIKVAHPGVGWVNIQPQVGEFYSDHFAQQLNLAGVRVVSAKEISAVIGLERQKQLLGCADDSSNCLVELADALGVDGIVQGSVGYFSGRYVINLKVVGANDASTLAAVTEQAANDAGVIDALTRAANAISNQLYKKGGRPPSATTSSAANPPAQT